MDITTFENFVDRHGGDLARWPAAARPAADRLLAESADARARLAEIRAVETQLRASSFCPAAGANRVAACASAGRQETRARRIALRAGVGAVAAAALALGILAGGAWAPTAVRDMSPDHVLAAALDSGGAGDVD